MTLQRAHMLLHKQTKDSHRLKGQMIIELRSQYDQIWRNFATWATKMKSGNTQRVYLDFDKILNLLWPILCYWANFHCSKCPKTKQINELCGRTDSEHDGG